MKVMMLEQIARVCYKYTFSLANALTEYGNEIVLAIDQKEEKENCTSYRWNLFNTDERNASKLEKLKNYIFSYKAIYKEMRYVNYDVLHTQWLIFSPVDYYFIKKIKRKCKVKYVVTIHDILPFNEKFYDYRYHKKIYTLADSIILQAENNRARFEKLFPELVYKTCVIPHGHFLEYAEPIEQAEARRYLRIPDNKFVFLFFGQIKKVKGLGVLLEAYSDLCKSYSKEDVLLIVAGKVWKDDFSQYQDIIEEKGIQDCVRTDIKFIPDEEIKFYYSACDCCVLPYLDVYQSGVIQLCYAYKKPVVATNIGAFMEIIVDGETGFLVETNNVESLANGLKKAINNAECLDEMGAKGYSYIEKKYSWKVIGSKINGIYHGKYNW